ncbi:MAG TPA: hypothetical protein VLA12_20365 [Planctomycetaceae bacterium]|nr:hypothetical protein [Planctomycetaceae bacterium]
MALNVYKEWLGIPEDQCPPDHYTLLRLVKFEDDPEKIQANYRKLNAHVRKYATGQHAKESQKLLNEIAQAMLCLKEAGSKRAYDQSLGREFEDEDDLLGRKSLSQTLIDEGHVSSDQMSEAENFADARGLSLRDAVVQMKLVDAETATRAYAAELGVEYVDLNETLPDDSVLDMVPRNLVKINTFIPLYIDDDQLVIAAADEPAQDLVDELRLRFGIPLRYCLATPLNVNQGISKYYAPGMRETAVDPPSRGGEPAAEPKQKKKAEAKSKTGPAEKPVKMTAREQAEEKADRKQIAIVISCFSITFAYLLGNFVVQPLLNLDPLFNYLIMLLIAGPINAWVWLVYMKKK